jgi:MFS family permease
VQLAIFAIFAIFAVPGYVVAILLMDKTGRKSIQMPNTTTFIYPAEIFPLEVRTTGHGISAAAGKMGAFVGAFLFPVMLASSMGVRGAEIVAGVVCLGGLALTAALLPEPKGKSLEELTADAYAVPEAQLEHA